MKRRVVVVALVLFALWPALHRALVARFDVNPWKLAGWAMYVRPHFPVEIELLRVVDGAELPIARMNEWERALADEFVESRYSIGRLASPDRLGAALLERRGLAEAVVVRVRVRRFDVRSATIEEELERLVVAR